MLAEAARVQVHQFKLGAGSVRRQSVWITHCLSFSFLIHSGSHETWVFNLWEDSIYKKNYHGFCWLHACFFFPLQLWRSTLKKVISLCNKFFKVSSFRFFFENQDYLCFWWEFRLWILTMWPSNLAYCGPIHLIFIKFQIIDSYLGTPPKNLSLPFNW
jgi:hypothetical protein